MKAKVLTACIDGVYYTFVCDTIKSRVGYIEIVTCPTHYIPDIRQTFINGAPKQSKQYEIVIRRAINYFNSYIQKELLKQIKL